MFQGPFSHYLSYGAADQETVNELREEYEGILVPGTVAAFQKEGTGGFVLALSASTAQIPYVIDPRSPLFQQPLPKPKKSHESLKHILGLPPNYLPNVESFNADLVSAIAHNWVKFNVDYQDQAGGKFSKYAKRLGEDGLDLKAASPPHIILPPYFVANSTDDDWWHVSGRIFSATCAAASEIAADKTCVQVVATEQALQLDALCESLQEQEELVLWVSDLNDIRSQISDLVAYGSAIRNAKARGQSVFGLYGGFFSVLLASSGLSGMSHGIGYGESRNWVELPQSGPPPKRYYLPSIHRYVGQELAEQIWQVGIDRCTCKICSSKSPLLLDYHEIMKHSVYCRAKEVDEWGNLPLEASRERLKNEYFSFTGSLESSKMAKVYKQQAENAASHIPMWLSALDGLIS